jgi:cytochrome b pre-mRNA-processing protein 3
MLKECARQADYSIPQSEQRNAEIPKSKDGEDLGVGTGWWYEGKSYVWSNSSHQLQYYL